MTSGASEAALEAANDEGALFEQLVPKEEEAFDQDIEPESPSDRLRLIRYDPLRHYLLEISKYEPLSADEEQRLARLFRDQQDKEAARRLVTSNLKLVVKIAFLYNKVYSNLMDLIQEGNIGLLQAVRKFDPDRGTRLPTYASWWIKAYIIKFILDNFRIVKVGLRTTAARCCLIFERKRRGWKLRGLQPLPSSLRRRWM